jgi:glyoxylase-like metal-dependent hydrolase (beta-lactamase superfamily II)
MMGDGMTRDGGGASIVFGSNWASSPLVVGALSVSLLASAACVGRAESLDRTARQWTPFVEWRLANETWEGNPYDLEATATFVHEKTGETHRTGLFYDGDKGWRFRFTATRPGRWTFRTASRDADLDGRTGVVTVEPNDDAYGFVTHVANRWVRPRGAAGDLEAFTPQFVMYGHPGEFRNKPGEIDADIEEFFVRHGFNGFHVPVLYRWFDIDKDSASDIDSDNPNPDPRTFEALELLIAKVHAAAGVVHLWAWGDESRRQTPKKWGLGGPVDKRLQRYIAARLGPLPGWTIGYGFDLWEWVEGEELAEWHRHMHRHFGWHHMLGARSSKNQLDQLCETLDYSSYEQHRPTHRTYLDTIAARPDRPAFSEDRFRIRQSSQYRDKDYDEELTRRGLWHSTLAGGVANIWGRLDGDLEINAGRGGSRPYRNVDQIKTWSLFFKRRFALDMNAVTPQTDMREKTVTSMMSADRSRYVFYAEDAESIELDLSHAVRDLPAVAVDTKQPYREIDLGSLKREKQTWRAPHRSDWAIGAGIFWARSRTTCLLVPRHTGECQLGKDHIFGPGYAPDDREKFVIYSFRASNARGDHALIDLGPQSVGYCNAMFRRHGFFRDLGEDVPAEERFPDDIVQPYGNVLEQLKKGGYTTKSVRRIVFTHLHADHHGMNDGRDGGLAELFTNATLHVSARGWQHNLAKRRDGQWGSYVDFAFSDFLVRREKEGKVQFADDSIVFPGVSTVYLGGHSECSQAVVVETTFGPAIIASDDIYLYELLEKNITPQIRTSPERWRAAVERLVRLAEQRSGILIPLHDPAVWEAYQRSPESWLKELRERSDRAIRRYRELTSKR